MYKIGREKLIEITQGYEITKTGQVYHNERLIKPTLKNGRLSIKINGRIVQLARIVYALYGNDTTLENKYVLYKDGNIYNNDIINLYLGTKKESLENRILPNSRKVSATNIKTGEVRLYESISECARELDLDYANIHRQIKGQLKQNKGWVISYAK